MDEQEHDDQQKGQDMSNAYFELERVTRVNRLVSVASHVLYKAYFDGQFALFDATRQDIELIVYYMFSSARISLKMALDATPGGSEVYKKIMKIADEDDHT